MEEPGRLQSMGSLESDTIEWLHFPFSLSCIGEGNGTPLQYSCLENPMDGGAWWAAVHGVARVGHDWATSLSLFLSCTGESGNPFQCSCLENPRDRGAWWAAICGVPQSRTRLKWLSSSSKPCVICPLLYHTTETLPSKIISCLPGSQTGFE